MSMISLFRESRTVRQFADRPVSRELVLSLLNDAVWAPNHRLREPWRFIGADGEAKQKLAAALEANRYSQTAAMIARAPTSLIVTTRTSKDRHVDSDDFAAVCCLIQNLQLLAWEQGLGLAWELADYSGCGELLSLADVHDDERIVGILGLGFFTSLPEKPKRLPVADRVEIW